MTYSERLGDAISYLEAVAIGLRRCKAGELGVKLEEIARNIESLAHGARLAERAANMPMPDALVAQYESRPSIFDDDLGDTHL